MAHSQAELDVSFDLPCMGGRVEAAEFHGSLREYAVEVQHAVPGAGVVDVAFIAAIIPDGFELVACGGFAGVQLVHEALVGFLAVVHPAYFDTQRGNQHILAAGKDICQGAEGLSGMGRRVDVDVDAAGIVGLGALTSEQPHDLLYGLHVSVVANGADDFATIPGVAGGRAIAEGGPDGSIAHGLPGAALLVFGGPGVVAAALVGVPGSKIGSHGLGSVLAGDAGQLDFDTEVLVLHWCVPPSL